MFNFFTTTILVSFVDQGTGLLIAKSNMSPAQLPETFALDTQFDLAGTPYVVVQADPVTKAEFIRTKRLTVVLHKVEMVDPKTIFFSLPTICNAALPESGSELAPAYVHVLHEDDWRQHEFVHISQQAVVSAELFAIRQNDATNTVPSGGWREIHIRKLIEHPMPKGIAWADIAKWTSGAEMIAGIAFGNRERTVAKAVARRFADGVILWGVEESGSLTVLCVEALSGATYPTILALKGIADDFALILVDWCRCQAYAAGGKPVERAGILWDPDSATDGPREFER